MTTENNPLEDLGRATLQIVHDLKNQLNGLKLYATFLRKRMERDERSAEEHETLAKLIAGLDRAARDMTALVRYAQPVELHRQPHTDLCELVSGAIRDVSLRRGTSIPVNCEIETSPLLGEFDAASLSEALQVLTEDAVNGISSPDSDNIALHVDRVSEPEPSQALIEWKGARRANRGSLRSPTTHGTVYTALAARIVQAHGGRFESDAEGLRVWLPLAE
jgi:signal transduction histidine kinase